ncbi:hypothetical protein QEZ48_19750 [Aquamicrobium lusatiense]|uniref:hypothetical protein n=1 Tax=Aquamicrobium lusatiense TaxID=89772 RepID=UPI002458670F|nr:hypothetical protein [Aquamicrobium lusatiense]MDH4993053.1 hypothetical protein [Aquamicrobium lusatiense]
MSLTAPIRLRVLPRLIPIDGKNVELRSTSSAVEWRNEGDDSWRVLVPISELTGPEGPKGDKGDPGQDGTMTSVQPGDNVIVDAADPANPVISTPSVSYNPQSLSLAQQLQAQANIGPVKFDTVAGLLSDTILDYTPASGRVAVAPGKDIEAQGFRYRVLAADEAYPYIQLAGGLRVRPLLDGDSANILACGANVGSYAVNNGPALQLAHDILPAGGGRIYIPRGAGPINAASPYQEANRWAFSTPVSFTKPVTLCGDGWESSVLFWNGPRDTIAISAGVYGISFEDIGIRGASDADGTVYILGSECVRSQGDIRTLRSDFSFFQRFSTWAGGYYHKHIGSKFHRFKTMFQDYTANNVQFGFCYFSRFERLILCNGGMGPVNFVGCSIEAFTSIAIGSTGGASFAVNLNGCYIENYPELETEKGIGADGSTYNTGYLVTNGSGTLTIKGSAISTKGIIRVLTTGGANSHVVSLGNRFILFNSGSNATLTQVFNASAGYTLISDDHIVGSPPSGATWCSTPARGSGHNPFTGAPIVFSSEAWTAPTFENGWKNDTSISGAATAAYCKIGQWVYLRGLITGADSTGTTAFTLPAGFRPASRVYAVAHAVATGEDETTFAINTDGTVVATTGTTGAKLSLDQIRFRTV